MFTFLSALWLVVFLSIKVLQSLSGASAFGFFGAELKKKTRIKGAGL